MAFHHIHGHQDDTAAYDDLLWPDQLNVDADAVAKAFLSEPPATLCSKKSPPHFVGNPILVSVAGTRVTKRLMKALTTGYNTKKMIPYILQHNLWNREIFNLVNWEAIGSAQG